MEKINNNELKKINGGGITFGTVIIVSALISFISGIISGIASPDACNK